MSWFVFSGLHFLRFIRNMRSHSLFGLLSLAFVLSSFHGNDAAAQYPGFNDPGSAVAGVSGAGIIPVETSVDGGSIPIGATGQVVLRFKNEGAQPVETGLIQLYPSSTVSASVASNQCNTEPLPAGAECAIALSVKGLQSGPWRVEMLMAHNGRSRLVTTTINGTVELGSDSSSSITSDIEANPSTIDFGTLKSSQTLVEPIVLRNVTSNPIDISKLYIDSSERAGYVLKTECERLDAGQACIATISWSPLLEGRSSGVFVIEHNGPSGMSSVPLKGEFTPDEVEEAEVFPKAVPGKGLMVASQSEIDFGSGVSTASTMTVSLVNAGDAPITIEEIRLAGTDNGLSFKGIGCSQGLVLEPVEACPLTLTWSPTRVGAVVDDVQIVHDGARGILVLPVRGDAAESVSQDQKAIVLSDGAQTLSSGSGYLPGSNMQGMDPDIMAEQLAAARANQGLANGSNNELASGAVMIANAQSGSNLNAASVLDGYKITSFSPTRAIINGPGGSRLVFDGEEIVVGGVPWFAVIQKNGIEFLHQGQRILLLFDRSLSSVNRLSSTNSSGSNASAPSADGG